eukprot:g19252.t1
MLQKDQPLNVTTSLEAHCRVVSQTHQASRPTFGGRLTRSARFGDLTRLPVALLEASERTQQAQALGAQIDRPGPEQRVTRDRRDPIRFSTIQQTS